MRQFRIALWILGLCLLASLSWAADPELQELKKMLQQVLEENRRLNARIEELERRLAAYERKEGAVPVAVQQEKPRVEIGLTVEGTLESVIGVDKHLANLHAHAGKEPAGTADMVATDEDKLYGSISVDFELEAYLSPQARIYMLMESGAGKNPEAEIPSFGGIEDGSLALVPVEIEEGDVRISEVWYERSWSWRQGNFRLRTGKIDVSAEIDQNLYANDEVTQFMSPSLVNNPAVEWPSYGFGILLAYERESWSLIGAYQDADGGWEDILDYPFFIIQWAYHLQRGNLAGNYRFYLWYHGEKHLPWEEMEDYFAGLITRPANRDPAWGWGFSWDQEITPEIGVFLRYGYRGGDLVGYAAYDDTGAFDLEGTDFAYGFEHALTLGVHLSGALWGRPQDEVGLGLAWFGISDKYEDYWEARGVFAARLADPEQHRHEARDEYHLELYYRWQTSERLALTPDFQYTWNPAGLEDDGFWVFSLRGVWEY